MDDKDGHRRLSLPDASPIRFDMRFSFALACVSLAALAGCVAPSTPAPRPAVPVPAPTYAPPPAPPAASSDWRDWAVTPGSWAYRQDARGSIALFGAGQGDVALTLRCDRSARQLYLSRKGSASGTMTIRTSSTARSLTTQPANGTAYVTVALPVSDPIVDAMGYSRGRFIVETAPLPPLVVPAWAEVLRVAEDCRG